MGQEIERITEDGEIISGLPVGYGTNSSLAVNLARAEIDQQIATARAMPRSVKRAIANITGLATLDEDSAEECVYALPRGGKPIKGPSIRLAEIIASQWGNCRVAARVVLVDKIEKFIEAEGVFHDLETNTATTARVRRRISNRAGKVFDDDMIVVTGNAACAIAKRNAILGAVPKGVWRKAYEAAEGVLVGDVKTLAERRDRMMKAFAGFGVTPDQIFVSLGIAGLEEINLDHLSTLIGTHSAIKSGETTVEEAFPRTVPAGDKPKDLGDALDKLAGSGADAKTDVAPKGRQEPQGGRQTAADDRPADPPTSKSADTPAPAQAAGHAFSFAAEVDAEADREDGDEGREQTPEDIAFDKGWNARRAGVARRAGPHFRTKSEADAWLNGWNGADAEIGG
jgi:ribosome modulation factor